MADRVVPQTKRERGAARPSWVYSRAFALANLSCALAAGALWYAGDGRPGAWPLLIAALPWSIRVVTGHFPVTRTRFDAPLMLFLLSAAVAAWVAYDPAVAWGKFWLLVGASVLFYALAGQRSTTLWSIVNGVAYFAAGLAVYFLLTHDWQQMPAKIGFLDAVALRWMGVRPPWLAGLHQLHPNVAGGIIAMLFPLSLVAALRAARRRQWAAGLLTAGLGILLSVGLVLTSSRGAWLALLGGFAAWGLWLAAGRLDRRLFLSRRQALGLGLAVMAGLGLTLVLLSPGGLVGILDRLPGPASAGSRLVITRDAINLAGDFPLTGGGLGSFDGLYSQYIQVIPYHLLIHGHNLFMNVWVEQGLVALLLLLSLLVAAFWWLADPFRSGVRRSISDQSLLCGALFACLVVMGLHGLVDDPLYGSRGALLLWLPLGLTAAVFPRRAASQAATLRPAALVAVGLLLVTLLAGMVAYRNTLQAIWQANLGAISMARVELSDYPSGEWADGRRAAELDGAAGRFERALALDPNNRTAWHRLGLIALLERDFDRAAGALSTAHQIDPDHRGIVKALGYSLVWAGDAPGALSYLRAVPEAAGELGAYTSWWSAQGRDDLSRQATEAAQKLTAPRP